MKRLFIYVLLACTFGNVAIAQNARKELVSQRIVNAINKGKFYMKVSGLMKIEDEGATQSMMPTFEIAVKGGASKFIPVSEYKNLRQRARTIDKEGNTTNSTIVYNRNYTGGVEGFNITKGRTEYRTGNTVRVERHVGYNFGFIKMTEYY